MLEPQDLQRLIDIITEEVMAAQGTALQRQRPGVRATRWWWIVALTGCAASSTPGPLASACTPPAAPAAACPR